MRIGIDGRCLQGGRNTGVEEYTRSLISFLIKKNNKDQFVVFLNSFSEIKESFDWLANFDNVEIKRLKWPNKLLNFCFLFFKWPKIDNLLGNINYFISPNFHFGALSRNCKQILTIHDLSFDRMPETFSWRRRLWHFFINPRKNARAAFLIWAVSESTAQDLVNLYRIDPKKIIVNYPIFNFEIFNQPKKNNQEFNAKYKLPKKFILFLGTIEPRKNIKGLVRGFESFKQRNQWAKDYKLVIAGGRGWLWQSIVERIKNSQWVKDIIITDFIREEDKSMLYAAAEVFVYPSFYEGFGFPPLEAMASGIPTIASNHSSMPEVLGDGAILINPYKSFEICVALELLLKDKKIYQLYSRKGKKQAEKIIKMNRNFSIK